MTSFRNTGDTLRIHTQPYFGKFRSVNETKGDLRGPGNEALKKRKEQTAFYNRFQPLAGPGNYQYFFSKLQLMETKCGKGFLYRFTILSLT